MEPTDNSASPLPLAGGVGGGPCEGEHRIPVRKGQFKPRNTDRARALRHESSPAERRLWRVLSNRKLGGYKFSRQMPIDRYFVDFLCRAAKLVVELDGFSHEGRQDYDRLRDACVVDEGFTVLRFTNADVAENLDGVVHDIAAALVKKGPPPAPPASGRGDATQMVFRNSDDHAPNQ